jgi:protein-tyrosine phosphatase
MRLLFVCTGNLCRSPLAERWSVAHVAPQLAAPAELHVESAGTAARAGEPMDDGAAAVLSELGGSSAGFRSRLFTGDLGSGADLVLTMTREQRRQVLSRHPVGLRSTFALREAAALATRLSDEQWAVIVSDPSRWLGALAAALHQGRATRAAQGDAGAEDVLDPIGSPMTVHRQVGNEIAGLLEQLFGPALSALGSVVRVAQQPTARVTA